MEWSLVFAGAAAAAVVGWIIFRGGAYRRLFAEGHFMEVAKAVGRIKAAALDQVIAREDDEVRSPADPRCVVTSAGLALVYTVRRVEDRFVHHYSVGVAGGYTAHAVGETFVLYAARLLGIPPESMALGVGRSTVHHAEFQLSASEQSEFAGRPVPSVTSAEVAAFRRDWREARKQLPWQRL